MSLSQKQINAALQSIKAAFLQYRKKISDISKRRQQLYVEALETHNTQEIAKLRKQISKVQNT